MSISFLLCPGHVLSNDVCPHPFSLLSSFLSPLCLNYSSSSPSPSSRPSRKVLPHSSAKVSTLQHPLSFPCSLSLPLPLLHHFYHGHSLYFCPPHRYHLWPVSVTATFSSLSGTLYLHPLYHCLLGPSVLSVSLCDTAVYGTCALSDTILRALTLYLGLGTFVSAAPGLALTDPLCFFPLTPVSARPPSPGLWSFPDAIIVSLSPPASPWLWFQPWVPVSSACGRSVTLNSCFFQPVSCGLSVLLSPNGTFERPSAFLSLFFGGLHIRCQNQS